MTLDLFPRPGINLPHTRRDYLIALTVFACVPIALIYDGFAPQVHQYALGVIAWVFLLLMLKGEENLIRAQVLVAVAFATLGENFASLYMEGYIYRFHNLPAYIPPGHGMVYLTAVVLGRSGLFQNNARMIAIFVVLSCGLWSLYGISALAERRDVMGSLLFCVFLAYLFKGRSPMVYLAAFFITTWLEIIGTAAGTWRWVDLEPVFALSQGNPPSGVAAWYCLVDAVALNLARPALNLYQTMHSRFGSYSAKTRPAVTNDASDSGI